MGGGKLVRSLPAQVHGARIVRSAIHGFVTLEASEAFIHDQDPDETFHSLVEFVVAGFEGPTNSS